MAVKKHNKNTPASPTRLFPAGLPAREWVEFEAAGFSRSVSGVIFRTGESLSCGVPLGAIDTGCIDLELDGTLGYCTIFNSNSPKRGKLGEPFLGLNVGGQTWVLTTAEIPGLTDDPGVKTATGIEYWGHYPMADVEFETDAPVAVGLRAWAPFIPGDVAMSNTPAAVFEVHLRNTSDDAQRGTIAMTFAGPTVAEALGDTAFLRTPDMGACTGGSHVANAAGVGYALGYVATKVGSMPVVRKGAHLGTRADAWAAIAHALPGPGYAWRPGEHDLGSSVAIDFSLAPGECKVIPLFLTWYAPIWNGSGRPGGSGNTYTHMYAARYWSAMEVAQLMTWDWRNLSRRICAWQQAIYASAELPPWLRDCLVNALHLIPEDSVWAQARPPIGEWCREADGLFGMNECPNDCPQIECLGCSTLGNFPLVFFFPELALSTLRAYKAYQYPNGQAPWVFGGATQASGGYEMARPGPGYQVTVNGPFYVVQVDRLWRCSGDDTVLREFYESVKKNTVFTMNLRPEWGAAGILSMPSGDRDTTGFEFSEWFGMSGYVGGLHLMNLRILERMAKAFGDEAFARQCEAWQEQAGEILEEELWAGDYYLANYDPETGRKTDAVFAYQLDGEWFTSQHGLPRVFRPDRVKTTLQTIKDTCIAASPYGAANFVNRDGTEAAEGTYKLGGCHGKAHFFVPELLMLAMLYMYEGEADFGLDLARRCMHGLVCRGGRPWDAANVVRGDTGEGVYGSDYYQNMIIWSLPLALEQGDLSAVRKPGGLVDRILTAAV